MVLSRERLVPSPSAKGKFRHRRKRTDILRAVSPLSFVQSENTYRKMGSQYAIRDTRYDTTHDSQQ